MAVTFAVSLRRTVDGCSSDQLDGDPWTPLQLPARRDGPVGLGGSGGRGRGAAQTPAVATGSGGTSSSAPLRQRGNAPGRWSRQLGTRREANGLRGGQPSGTNGGQEARADGSGLRGLRPSLWAPCGE